MRLGDGDGETMAARRIAVEKNTPTRDGEAEVHVLTGLPAEVADALAIAAPYRRRRTVGAALGELASCLDGEADTLAYPRAALFASRVASVSYNVTSVVIAALRSARGEEAVEGLSFSCPADEVAGTQRGTMIAIPEGEWAVFHGLTATAFGGVLMDLAAGVRLSSYRGQVCGPRRPRPRREGGARIRHFSTARLLGARRTRVVRLQN